MDMFRKFCQLVKFRINSFLMFPGLFLETAKCLVKAWKYSDPRTTQLFFFSSKPQVQIDLPQHSDVVKNDQRLSDEDFMFKHSHALRDKQRFWAAV